MILAENVTLSEGYKENQSVLVLGVPGSGKSRSHVLVNLMDMDSSFLILDPKGDLYDTSENMLRSRGYNVLCVDFDTPFTTKSFYNPFAHLHTEEDIIRMSELLVSGQRKTTNDRFWPDSSMILSNALIAYLFNECNSDDQTLASMMKLLGLMDAKCAECDLDSTLDRLFSVLSKRQPDSFAVQQYSLLRQCAPSEKTYASIIMSLIATFVGFMTKGIQHLTSKDTIDFRKLGTEHTAIFVKSSDSDRSKDPLISIFFQQALDELYREADSRPAHCLPVHVHFFLDDFGTNLTINRFDSYIAGMRSREISCSVILQSEGQLRAIYGAAWNTILGSCQSYVFLGSNDLETCKGISIRIDKPLSHILYKKAEDIFVFTQGQLPVKAKRYDIKSHPNYSFLKDVTP